MTKPQAPSFCGIISTMEINTGERTRKGIGLPYANSLAGLHLLLIGHVHAIISDRREDFAGDPVFELLGLG